MGPGRELGVENDLPGTYIDGDANVYLVITYNQEQKALVFDFCQQRNAKAGIRAVVALDGSVTVSSIQQEDVFRDRICVIDRDIDSMNGARYVWTDQVYVVAMLECDSRLAIDFWHRPSPIAREENLLVTLFFDLDSGRVHIQK
jgi:hypothetical protein